MSERYLIRKRGFYYRPNSSGYTANIHDAGCYSEEEAQVIGQNPLVDLLPISMMRDHFKDEIDQLEKSTATMKQRLAELNALQAQQTEKTK